MPLLSFQEAWERVPEGESPSILLGNGFSQAWDHNIFNYQSLFQSANFGTRDQYVKDIFNHFETFDFEAVMRTLEGAEEVCRIYQVSQNEIDAIHEDQENLKNSLVTAISNGHPARSSGVSSQQYENARAFIKRFGKTFTVNYDLLLYWIVNKTDIEPLGRHHWNDGFYRNDGVLMWGSTEKQSIFFLHGALHLYKTSTLDLKKHVFRSDLDHSIVEQVRANLNLGIFPLFVSEPSYQKKLAKIKANPYLSDCYINLRKLDGVLFIHGHSMAETDKHIFEQIERSGVDTVFISIYGDPTSEANRQTMANAQRFLTKNIEFYDASTAPIWS